ncbi:MAG: hypothetical protein RBT57_02785 [Paludibacter sp.]|jgi:hypothetical protein|nr:hypothetical protein [Paludibacter sp.]
MKALYELIIGRLKLVPEIKWVDKKNGQQDSSLSYPGVLISFASTNKDITESGDQEQDITVTLTAVFDGTGLRSSSNVSAATFDRALDYERICDDIYKKLQGYSTSDFEAFSCKSIGDDTRTDGYISKTMIFQTSGYYYIE